MEFKGTKGKWKFERHTHPLAGYLILNDNDCQLAIADNDYIKNINQCKYNALLISKAPEMLEMLKNILWAVENSNIEADVISIEELEKLIKEATEL